MLLEQNVMITYDPLAADPWPTIAIPPDKRRNISFRRRDSGVAWF